MLAQWTSDLVGQMHKHKVSQMQLADEMGMTREYVSMVLNGHREPAGAESKFFAAFQRIVDRLNSDGGQEA